MYLPPSLGSAPNEKPSFGSVLSIIPQLPGLGISLSRISTDRSGGAGRRDGMSTGTEQESTGQVLWLVSCHLL